MRRCVISILFVLLSQISPDTSQAQTVAVLDATRQGDVFNLVDGTAMRGMRRAILEVADSIVPLASLVDLDATEHDIVILHNGFSLSSPMPAPLTTAEQQALRDYVEDGGAALLAADSYGGGDGLRSNSIVAPFDVVLDGFTGGGYVEIENPADHPVTSAQATFRTDRPSWFTDLGPCAIPLASLESPGGPVLAVIDRDALASGSGRVVLTSDANWVGDASVSEILYFEEHETLFLDMLDWLLGSTTAPSGNCDDEWTPVIREGAFESCRRLPQVNGSSLDYGASVTRDDLCLVFESSRPGGQGGSDLYMATREAVDTAFQRAEPLVALNSRFHETSPNISPDGLKIYFSRTQEADRFRSQTGRIFVATRTSRADPFGEPTLLDLPGLSGGAAEAVPSEDDLTLIIEVRTGGNRDLFEATREAVDLAFGTVRPMDELNSTQAGEEEPSMSADGLALFFSRDYGSLWWSTRPARRDESGAPVPFDPPRFVLDCVRSAAVGDIYRFEASPFITPDWPAPGSKLYFTRYTCRGNDCGGDDIWEATWNPAATSPEFLRGDCNGDGAVNIADATCILNWLFAGGEDPGCVAATNTNGDPASNITDATFVLNHLFSGGPPPVAPFPECGAGTLPADEALGCASPPACQ